MAKKKKKASRAKVLSVSRKAKSGRRISSKRTSRRGRYTKK